MQNLHATCGQSLINVNRLAASRMQIAPVWPPVTSKINKIDGNLPATGGHMGTIWMRLAASRVQFVSYWPPVACKFCTRLAAILIQFVCDWPPDAHYFSTMWPPVACKLYPNGRQSQINFKKYVYFMISLHLWHSLVFYVASFTQPFTAFLCTPCQISERKRLKRN